MMRPTNVGVAWPLAAMRGATRPVPAQAGRCHATPTSGFSWPRGRGHATRSCGRAVLACLTVLCVVALVCGCQASRAAALDKARAILPRALESSEPAMKALALEIYRDLLQAFPESQRDSPDVLFAPADKLNLLLADEKPSVRFTTLVLKAEQALPTDRPRFEQSFREESDASVRLAAVYGLARLGDFRYMNFLAEGLAAQDDVQRRNAAMILGLLGHKSAAGMLKERLGDPDPVVRLNVAESMARLGDFSGVPAVRAVARDTQSPLAVNAILVLGRIGTPGEDIKLLRDVEAGRAPSGGAARLAAFGARAQLGDYTQIQPVIEVAEGKDIARGFGAPERAFALQLLARASYGPAWREASACLDDGDPYVRLSAAWAMLSFHTPRAEKVFRTANSPERPKALSEREILRPKPPAETGGAPMPGPLTPVAPRSR